MVATPPDRLPICRDDGSGDFAGAVLFLAIGLP
jgi:hypothetical protein